MNKKNKLKKAIRPFGIRPLIRNIAMLLVGLMSFSFASEAQDLNKASAALQNYLHNDDNYFRWELKDSFRTSNTTGYDLYLVSQKWRHLVWKHQLTLFVPDENEQDGALLVVTGGHNNEATQDPNWKQGGREDVYKMIAAGVAEKNKATVAVLRQIPNEPLFGGKTEDEIISYTFHQFNETHDYSWPLLFPMVKGAVRAMDAIQEFSNQHFFHPIRRFVVTGASKRGWTTWLTGANDPRVVAIAPMVIDILNMPVNLKHQMDAYGEYSVEIQDYVNLGIVDGMGTPDGEALVKMVDPYSYRKFLTMPKLIMMGTNDPYWVIDNVKNYLPEIPGHNNLNYTPNAGHGLNKGVVAFPALSAFFGIAMADGKFPTCEWTTSLSQKGIALKVKADKDRLLGASLWSAESEDRDFRDEEFKSQDLGVKGVDEVQTTVSFPSGGYKAFYIDLIYEDPNGGEYTVSTRTFVADQKTILE